MNPGFIETTEKEIGEWKGVDKEEYENPNNRTEDVNEVLFPNCVVACYINDSLFIFSISQKTNYLLKYHLL
jgi:hypothetical protein